MRSVPLDAELLTDRLRLRRWRRDDVAPLSAIDGDAEVMRYIGDGSVRTLDQTIDAVVRFEQRWHEQGFGLFAAELIETGELAGWVGLAVPSLLPEIMPAVEIGWRLAKQHWGLGLATEGARAVLTDGFGRCNLHEIVSVRHVDNAASGRVMAKLGFTDRLTTTVPSHGRPVIVAALTRTEYLSTTD